MNTRSPSHYYSLLTFPSLPHYHSSPTRKYVEKRRIATLPIPFCVLHSSPPILGKWREGLHKDWPPGHGGKEDTFLKYWDAPLHCCKQTLFAVGFRLFSIDPEGGGVELLTNVPATNTVKPVNLQFPHLSVKHCTPPTKKTKNQNKKKTQTLPQVHIHFPAFLWAVGAPHCERTPVPQCGSPHCGGVC